MIILFFCSLLFFFCVRGCLTWKRKTLHQSRTFLKEYHVFITVTANTVSILIMTRVYVGFRAILSLTPQAVRRVRIFGAVSHLNTAPGTVTDKEVVICVALYAAGSFLRTLTGALFVTVAVTPYVPTVLRTPAGWATATLSSSSAWIFQVKSC